MLKIFIKLFFIVEESLSETCDFSNEVREMLFNVIELFVQVLFLLPLPVVFNSCLVILRPIFFNLIILTILSVFLES